MADTTVTVKQDGTGDYTSISAAENAANVSSGFYKIVIDDSNTYNEAVMIDGATGTANINNYVWLTVSAGNRHDGVMGNGAVLTNTSINLDIRQNFTRVEHLEIQHQNTWGMQLIANNVLISRCMIITNNNGARGISNVQSADIFIDNCVFAGQGQNAVISRFCVAALHFDHCTIGPVNVANSYSASYAAIRNEAGSAGGETNFYNNIIVDTYPHSYSASNSSSGVSGTSNITDAGSHNVIEHSYGNAYNAGSTGTEISASSFSDTSSGSTVVSVNETNYSSGGGLDYTLTNLTVNPAAGAGTNRIGSEPDPRQDFSTDIAGNVRKNKAGYIDVGAYQATAFPAGFKYYNGSNFVDTTAVQYYNGSAWVDVTGIQYYNGSAWTDPS